MRWYELSAEETKRLRKIRDQVECDRDEIIQVGRSVFEQHAVSFGAQTAAGTPQPQFHFAKNSNFALLIFRFLC